MGINHFHMAHVARRYDHFRPKFHLLVMAQLRDSLQLKGPVADGLDVGCGTGHSTRALRQLAERVVGVDLSAEMLAQAPDQPGVRYVEAPAESIPQPSASFDLITTGMAFHWFDQPRFLAEAARLLRPGGWLVVYNNYFTGRMRGNPAVADWMQAVYLQRFPSPPRTQRPLANVATANRWRLLQQLSYENDITFKLDELVGYLTTQSNILAAVAAGQVTLAQVTAWLVTELTPFFSQTLETFIFAGDINLLQPVREVIA